MPSTTIERITEITAPHLKAINEAIEAAFPDQKDQMVAVAIAFQLCILLQALDPAVRLNAVIIINAVLGKIEGGYRLTQAN